MPTRNIVTTRRPALVVSFHNSLEGIRTCSVAVCRSCILEEPRAYHVVGLYLLDLNPAPSKSGAADERNECDGTCVYIQSSPRFNCDMGGEVCIQKY
jgi:hypothetical protein